MDYLKLCCVAPHPPILVPEVGGREAQKVKASAEALRALGDEIESISPDTLVIMSPHSPIYADAFAVKGPRALGGSLGQFGAPQVRYDSEPDLAFAESVAAEASSLGIPCEVVGGEGFPHRSASELDHGILVPLYFLARKRYPLVCLSMSLLDMKSHYMMGLAMRRAVERMQRKTVFIASGDMSHRLTPSAPAGYDPRAADFDRAMVDIISSGEFSRLFDLDEALVADAGECGLRSVFALAGAMDGYSKDSEVLSYEGPFGVGYLVARVAPGRVDAETSLIGGEGGP